MQTRVVQPLISVIIPARDEAIFIGRVVNGVARVLADIPHETVVVDDGSEDETALIARECGAVVLTHTRNRGKGAAIQTGARLARGSILVFLDGDGSHDPSDIPRIVAPLLCRQAELVIGVNPGRPSRQNGELFLRHLCSLVASLAMSVLISVVLPMATRLRCPVRWTRISDCTSGFRALTKDVYGQLNLVSEGFEFEAEVVFEVARNQLRIAEVPVIYRRSNDGSHLSIVRDGIRTLRLLAAKLFREFTALR